MGKNKDYKKGRADAAKGKYDPPSSLRHTMFGSDDKRTSERRQDYREGYHDKKNKG